MQRNCKILQTEDEKDRASGLDNPQTRGAALGSLKADWNETNKKKKQRMTLYTQISNSLQNNFETVW